MSLGTVSSDKDMAAFASVAKRRVPHCKGPSLDCPGSGTCGITCGVLLPLERRQNIIVVGQ